MTDIEKAIGILDYAAKEQRNRTLGNLRQLRHELGTVIARMEDGCHDFVGFCGLVDTLAMATNMNARRQSTENAIRMLRDTVTD
jgi:hypothetical protein